MKHKKSFFITAGMAVLMLGALTGCSNYYNYTYDNAEKYVAGDQVITDKIDTIDIDYMSGNVHLTTAGTSGELTVKETTKAQIEDSLKVHTRVDGSTLYVRYCASGSGTRPNDIGKQLEIQIPSANELKNLKIHLASGDVTAEGIVSEIVDIDTASGNITADINKAKTVNIDPSSGDTILKAGSIEKLNYDAASGDGTFTFDSVPKDSLFDAASGDVSIFLPENSDVRIDVDTASGDVEYDLPFSKNEDTYTLGSGTNKMLIDTASGDVSIKKK